MKKIRFSEEKDTWLREKRGLGFREISKAIIEGKLFKVIEHTNKNKYKNQKIFLIKLKDYIYAVPFIEEKDFIFLKTVYPSRKYTKKYLNK